MTSPALFSTLIVIAVGQPITKQSAFGLKASLLSKANGKNMAKSTFYKNIDDLLEAKFLTKISPKRYALTPYGFKLLAEINMYRPANNRRMFLLKDSYRAMKSMRGSKQTGR